MIVRNSCTILQKIDIGIDMDSINQELVERERQRLELSLESPLICSLSQNGDSANCCLTKGRF
jgi:hypothetical protein